MIMSDRATLVLGTIGVVIVALAWVMFTSRGQEPPKCTWEDESVIMDVNGDWYCAPTDNIVIID